MFISKKFLLCSLMSSLISLNIAASQAQAYLLESASHVTKLQQEMVCIAQHLNDRKMHNLKYSKSPELEDAISDAANSFFFSKFAETGNDFDVHTCVSAKVQNVDDQTFRSLQYQVQLFNIQCHGRDSKLKNSEEALAKAKIAMQKTVVHRKEDPQAYDAACTILGLCRNHHDYQRLRYSALETQRSQLIARAIALLELKKQS